MKQKEHRLKFPWLNLIKKLKNYPTIFIFESNILNFHM